MDYDLGMGCPELGSVDLNDLLRFCDNRTGLGLERDRFFKGSAPLSAYVKAAQQAGRIVEIFS